MLIGLAITLSGCTLPWQKPATNNPVACTEEAKLCPDGSAVGRQGPNCEFVECPVATTTLNIPSTQIANPASVNCKAKGGTSEIITAGDGSQSGICKFPDGTQCEEWALYRNECKPGVSPVTDLKLYNNTQLGISFEYPPTWPVPVYQSRAVGSGGYPSPENPQWRLKLGDIANGDCEGENCYLIYFDSYSVKDSVKAYNELKSDSLITNLTQSTDSNGVKIVKYSEVGMSDNRNAMIFGQNQLLILRDRRGNNSSFDKIISSFKFIK